MIHAKIAKRFPRGPESAGFTLDVEFEAGPGITVLFGPSGAGKTLTLDVIAGLTSPDTGRILLNDRILFDSGAKVNLAPRERLCGYVFQNYALFPHMTLRGNMAFAAHSLPRLERHRRVGELLDKFRLTGFAGRFPHELSGGQKQRGSIARALIAQPKILLFDEPARGLDLTLRAELYEVIQDLKATLNIPILLVTHGVEEFFALAKNVLVFEPGRILRRGSPMDLLQNPGSEAVAKLLGDFCFVDGQVLALDPSRQTSRVLVLKEELQAPYLPGCFLGDRIRLSVRPEELRVHTKPGQNRIRASLKSAAERPQAVRAHFDDGLIVDVPRDQWREIASAEAFWVELPALALRRVQAVSPGITSMSTSSSP